MTTTCPICNHSKLRSFLTCRDHISGDIFDILICTVCGFGITQNVPDEKEIERYYDSEIYISHSDTLRGIKNKLYHIARNISIKQKVNRIKQLNISNGTLLDYGSGTGYFAYAIRNKGWQVEAIERSEKARFVSKENLGIIAYQSLEEASFSNSRFDVITLWHVLEHLYDLNEEMNSMHKLLTDEGHLIIACPNKRSFDAKKYMNNWAAYDVPRHLWHFSPSNMKELTNKHGFRIISMKAMVFDPFYISILSEQYKNSSLYFVKGLFYGLLSFLAGCRKVEESSSIVYILKKKR